MYISWLQKFYNDSCWRSYMADYLVVILLPKDSMQPYLGNTSGGECVQMLTDSVEDV